MLAPCVTCLPLIIIVLLEGLSLLQSIPPTTAKGGWPYYILMLLLLPLSLHAIIVGVRVTVISISSVASISINVRRLAAAASSPTQGIQSN